MTCASHAPERPRAVSVCDSSPITLPRQLRPLSSLTALKAIAALTVAWNHFTLGNSGGDLASPLLAAVVTAPSVFHDRSVLLFFVISGIGNSFLLARRERTAACFRSFLVRLFYRLYVPFVCSLGLNLLLNYISSLTPAYRGAPFAIDAGELLANLSLTAAFVGEGWISPVYWNLPLQLQYAVFAGLLWLSSASRTHIATCMGVLLCVVGPLIGPAPAFWSFFPFFFVGWGYFRLLCQGEHFRSVIPLLAVGIVSVALHWGTVAALLCLAPAVLERAIPRDSRTLAFLGQISFSLYLTHTAVGGRVMNLLGRFGNSDIHKILSCLAAMTVSIAFAYLFYLVIESPTHSRARQTR